MFNNILSEASSLLASTQPQQVAGATRDHVAQMPAENLATHLAGAAPTLDGGSLAQLGQALLRALANHGHDESQANDGGIDTSAASNGDQQNVVALIQHAQQHPAALRDAVVSFVEKNPQVLAQVPGLMEGVLGRLKTAGS